MTLKSSAFNLLKLHKRIQKVMRMKYLEKEVLLFLKSARQLRLFGFNRKNDKKDLQKAKIIASINNCRRAMSRKAGGLRGSEKNEQKQLTKASCFSKIINAVREDGEKISEKSA